MNRPQDPGDAKNPSFGMIKPPRPFGWFPQEQSFLLRFNLGPPEGFSDEEEEELPSSDAAGQPGQSTAELRLGQEGHGGRSDSTSIWLRVNANGMVGEFTTHFRTYFSGWIGMFTGGTGL